MYSFRCFNTLQEQKNGFIQTELLIGVGAGLILPSFYDLACKHVLDSGEPLILTPPSREINLIAHDYAGNGFYTLNWGDPYSDLPSFDDMTWRQFADAYMHGAEGYLDIWEMDGIDPDEPVEGALPRKRGY